MKVSGDDDDNPRGSTTAGRRRHRGDNATNNNDNATTTATGQPPRVAASRHGRPSSSSSSFPRRPFGRRSEVYLYLAFVALAFGWWAILNRPSTTRMRSDGVVVDYFSPYDDERDDSYDKTKTTTPTVATTSAPIFDETELRDGAGDDIGESAGDGKHPPLDRGERRPGGGEPGRRPSDDADDDWNKEEQQEEEEDLRPWMIVHVGPPKTATTTIQEGLAEHAERLAEDDGLYFLGHKTHESANLGTPPDGNFTVYTLSRMFGDVMNRDIRWHLERNHSIVMSAEQFSSHPFNFAKFYENKFAHRSPETLSGPKINRNKDHPDYEPGFGFRVRIVVAYRHLFEWLPSQYGQQHLVAPAPGGPNHPGLVRFTEKFLDRMVVEFDPAEDGFTNADHAGITGEEDDDEDVVPTYHGSVFAYLKFAIRPELRDRVDLFDLHQQPRRTMTTTTTADDDGGGGVATDDDVFANFVCQALPSAVETCSRLRSSGGEVIRLRTSSHRKFLSDADRHRLIWSLLPPSDRDDPKAVSRASVRSDLWFARNGLHGGSLLVVEGRGRPNPLVRDLTRCLDASNASRLKTASWNSLVHLVRLRDQQQQRRRRQPDGDRWSATPTDHLLLSGGGYDDDDAWMEPTKAVHDAAFEAFVAKKRLCELDVEAVLRNENFTRFVLGDDDGDEG